MDNLTPIEERALISLAFDEPSFFSFLMKQLNDDYFSMQECKFVFTILKHHYETNAVLPSRELTKDIACKYITVDTPNYEEILNLFSYKIDPRDYEIVKKDIIEWLKNKAYGTLFSDEGIDAYSQGDYQRIHDLVNNAARVQDIGSDGLWFFDDVDPLFEENYEVKYTTGFPTLDPKINDGGPTDGDVLIWMAPTGVGKSITLINNAAACIARGLDVLHITFELSKYKTALRYCGVFSKVPIHTRMDKESYIRDVLRKIKSSYRASLAIYEYPPDDVSIDTIMALMDHLQKTYNWRPKVVVLDYLEQMVSHNPYFNREEYGRQKKVSTEVRQLAKKTGCLILTATQTNRTTGDKNKKDAPGFLDTNRVAESYGKMMPADYVISINQTAEEYEEKKVRLYIAKNRNGPKGVAIPARIDYDTMLVSEIE